LAIGAFALRPGPAYNQRELLTAIRGIRAQEKLGCGKDTVTYDFSPDDHGAIIRQGDESLGRVVTAQAGVIIVYRTVGGVREHGNLSLTVIAFM
jgi:hypothetical protein